MSVRAALQLEVSRATAAWAPSSAKIGLWAQSALGAQARGRTLGVRVVGAAESRRLNRRWRGKDHPTNVLSFPTRIEQLAGLPRSEAKPLGDLVICAQVVRREATAQRKPLAAHWAHLVVHGALHLVGYDHESGRREQARMERREIRVLRALGIGNPYMARE
jgi:probable rRNA maturation factor